MRREGREGDLRVDLLLQLGEGVCKQEGEIDVEFELILGRTLNQSVVRLG